MFKRGFAKQKDDFLEYVLLNKFDPNKDYGCKVLCINDTDILNTTFKDKIDQLRTTLKSI